jgi:hypothetical protein
LPTFNAVSGTMVLWIAIVEARGLAIANIGMADAMAKINRRFQQGGEMVACLAPTASSAPPIEPPLWFPAGTLQRTP